MKAQIIIELEGKFTDKELNEECDKLREEFVDNDNIINVVVWGEKK